MPRKNKNNNHRGRGGGRGGGGGRGRGRGAPNGVPTAGRAPRHDYPHMSAEIDVVVQQWAEPSTVPDTDRGGSVNRGSGPRRGGTPKSRSGAGTPRRGMDNPWRGDFGNGAGRGRGRGRSRGRGRGWGPGDDDDHFSASRRPRFGGVGVNSKARTLRKDAPLSDLLYSERPLLRPVKFVRSTSTPFLFQYSEELLEPASQAANMTETSHVPTAARVAQLFHANAPDPDSESENHAGDALEEIEFADLARVRAEIDAIAQGIATLDKDAHKDQDDIEEVNFADLSAMRAQVDAAEVLAVSRNDTVEEAFTGVYNQTKDMTQVPSTMDVNYQPHGVQQLSSLSASPTLRDSLDLEPSIETPDLSNHKSFLHAGDAIVVEEEVPCSSNVPPGAPVQEPPQSIPPDTPYDDTHPLFVVDTIPTHPFIGRSASDVILVDRAGHGETLGDQDEELIVYVAPHPRSGRVSPVPVVPRVKLPKTSVLTGMSLESGSLRSPVHEDDATGMVPASDRDPTRAGLEGEVGEDHHISLASLNLGPATSASTSSPSRPPPAHANPAPRARKKKVRPQRRNKRDRAAFGAFGAMMSKARLREEDVRERQCPRWETRRKEGSDVDWGTEDEDENGMSQGDEADGVDAVSDGLGGMEIDPDLPIDVNAMQGFLKSMSAEGSRFVTMDDIADEAQMQREDEEGDGGPQGSSNSERSDEERVETDEEEEEAFNIEEEILIAESEGDEELSEDSDDDDAELSPQSSFQARLRKVREQSRSQHPKSAEKISDDTDEEIHQPMPSTNSADDEKFIAHINDLLEKNSKILLSGDRERETAVSHDPRGEYIDNPEFTTPVKKKKGKGKQWTGPFSAEMEAQWAKDRAKKAQLKQARENARLRAVNMESVEAQIRRFVEDVGGQKTLVLPPMDREMRKQVHEMAAAFRVGSRSKGKGNERHTTLFKTSQTWTKIKEGKVKALMKRSRDKTKGGQVKRHREGDEVGKGASKIAESNIGFKMLASMGWSEGDRIGSTESVGIDAPLTAIIKHSKLGLGATRE